ncbi:MAG: hypothetical protein H0T51_07840 [Pirellulales bacterium]|nr:hypothetical protein [Pirellulales bacterium]
MERIVVELDAAKYDAAIRGTPDKPALPEYGDLAFYVKPGATAEGKAAVVVTFTVQLPDGSSARAQAVTTAALIESALGAFRGWREGGHLG